MSESSDSQSPFRLRRDIANQSIPRPYGHTISSPARCLSGRRLGQPWLGNKGSCSPQIVSFAQQHQQRKRTNGSTQDNEHDKHLVRSRQYICLDLMKNDALPTRSRDRCIRPTITSTHGFPDQLSQCLHNFFLRRHRSMHLPLICLNRYVQDG